MKFTFSSKGEWRVAHSFGFDVKANQRVDVVAYLFTYDIQSYIAMVGECAERVLYRSSPTV